MRVTSTDDVIAMIDGVYVSAALGVAMELGLFWVLADGPREATDVAHVLGIPARRCGYWLQLLCSTGLLERRGARYAVSAEGRIAILDAYSQESWAFVARENRKRLPAVTDLVRGIREPGSVWESQGRKPPDYFAQMVDDPGRARAFTRTLFEIHQPMAEALANSLNMDGVDRMMDLGGGSGVMSMALLRRYPNLSAVVVDIPNVCVAGRELAREYGLEGRISYQPADFIEDDLPSGFDLVLECDVAEYEVQFLRKLWRALRPGGRLVIIDKFAPGEGIAPETHRHWAFLASLVNPDYGGQGAPAVLQQLEEAGFALLSERILPAGESERWSSGWTIIEARRAEDG